MQGCQTGFQDSARNAFFSGFMLKDDRCWEPFGIPTQLKVTENKAETDTWKVEKQRWPEETKGSYLVFS